MTACLANQNHSQYTELLHAKIPYCTMFTTREFEIYNIDISSAKYSSWQEMRAVVFRKACSNYVY